LSGPSIVQPALLSRLNERQVLRAIQDRGPLSRAEVARHSGMSAPTASRAVEALLRAGFLEEGEAPGASRGRPARKLRLATETAQVLGLVVDAEECRIAAAGLDGLLHERRAASFATPPTYARLIETAAEAARHLIERSGVATLGLAISLPGLVDYREQRGVLSPNLPATDGHSPSRDLSARLGVPCVMIQESHALCLAERHFGGARGIDDFAMLDVSTGVGLGVMTGGRLLTGHSGLAGEIGHITVEPDGRLCGCGNVGCLETVASDAALARVISQRVDRRVRTDEAIRLIRSGELDVDEELRKLCRHLAIGVAAIINLYNPSTLFLHGQLFDISESFLPGLIEETRKRALPPAFGDCRIARAQGSKQQGAVAAIIERLTNSVVPELDSAFAV
jgi:predicted NBD/HSP70 family sugar kinase